MSTGTLSGDRAPGMSEAAARHLAVHRLFSADEAARAQAAATSDGRSRRPPLHSITSALPLTLHALGQAMELEGDALFEHCIRFVALRAEDPDGLRRTMSVQSLLSDLAWALLDEDDEEGCVVTGTLFSRLLTDELRALPAGEFLRRLADRYLDSTRYLLPLLAAHADATASGMRERGSDDLYLFLRDGLCFWPALRARLQGEVNIQHLVYTRPLRHQKRAPLITTGNDGTGDVEKMTPVRNATLLDVGLYGTLIQTLHDSGFLQNDNAVLFLGSRNPHIAGFMNVVGNAEGNALSVPDIVRLIDTVECLLKPIQLVTVGDHVSLRLADPISFICAARFMSALYHYDGPARVEPFSGWIIDEAIPAWSGADDFINRFNVPSCRSAGAVFGVSSKDTPR